MVRAEGVVSPSTSGSTVWNNMRDWIRDNASLGSRFDANLIIAEVTASLLIVYIINLIRILTNIRNRPITNSDDHQS